MPFSFRPSTPADAGAVAELCERVLAVPERSPVFSATQLQWKYWDPWPTWEGSRSFLLFADGRPIAHAGIVPLQFARDGRTYRLVQLIDWAAEPTHVGAGVTLLKRIAALADGAMSVRGSTMTQRILKPAGFRALGDTVQYAARSGGGEARIQSELFRATALRVHAHGRFDAREHPLRHAESSAERILFQRSAQQYETWLACPAAPLEYGEVLAGERLIGTFVLCHTPGQARIVDAWADDQLEGAWDALIQRAYLYGCEDRGASEVICQSNDPSERRALEACGFVVTGSDPLAVLIDPALVPDGALVRHHLLDSDLAYLHHGKPEAWLT